MFTCEVWKRVVKSSCLFSTMWLGHMITDTVVKIRLKLTSLGGNRGPVKAASSMYSTRHEEEGETVKSLLISNTWYLKCTCNLGHAGVYIE